MSDDLLDLGVESKVKSTIPYNTVSTFTPRDQTRGGVIEILILKLVAIHSLLPVPVPVEEVVEMMYLFLPSSPTTFLLLVVLVLFQQLQLQLQAQQSYVNNKQLRCYENPNITLGFVCNAAPSCTSYITFRSTSIYNSPATIGYLLAADPAQIAAANNISDVASLPIDTLLIVPLNCSCSGDYYQHNASYLLKHQGETYFEVANNTYQALTTCQAMMAQNPAYNDRRLFPEMKLAVPLRCACPTPTQIASGYNYLLTYLIRQGNDYDYIARTFGSDVKGILDANMLTQDQRIFFFTPILVPLKTPPTKLNIHTPPPLPPTTIPASASQGGDSSSSKKWIFIGAAIILVVILSSILAVWFFRRQSPSPSPSPPPPPKLRLAADESGCWSEDIRSATETLTIYKFEDLDKATSSFAESNRINGSSSVYRGSFKGDDAVVKIMKGDVSGEVAALRKINHSHIIRLSGFCLRQGITYLVYEYAEKGSLTQWLHAGGLNWIQRVQIAYDVADALNYLHNFTNPPYIHKNLTTSNILVDGNMRAKITNFGLSRTLDTGDEGVGGGVVTRHVVGTYGYMAPEYIESGLVTPKLDVFALGVIMLELLSGKEAITIVGEDQVMLHRRIQEVLNVREKLREFMDPSLGEEYPFQMAYSMGELASKCVAHTLEARPSVSHVFMLLSKLLSFSLDWDPSLDDTFHSFSQ